VGVKDGGSVNKMSEKLFEVSSIDETSNKIIVSFCCYLGARERWATKCV
jgi:hypothetical protein